MTDKLKKGEAAQLAKIFNEANPKGTEVAVLDDSGARWIGEVFNPAIVTGDGKAGFGIEAGVFRGGEWDTEIAVPITRIRKRAIETRKTSNPVRVALTVDERLAAGDEIADAQALIQTKTADLDQLKKSIGADVKGAESVVEARAELLRAGYEVRTVECELTIDYDLGVCFTTREDTGEEVNRRPLRPDERDQELELFPDAHPQADESGDVDESMLKAAYAVIQETHRVSTTMIQRRLKIGYTRAASVIEMLEERGIIGPPSEAGREILVDLDDDMPAEPGAPADDDNG